MARLALLSCGAISSVLYLAGIDIIAALAYPGYHEYRDQMVSELIAVGAPTRPLTIWLFIPYNLLVFAFAAGVLMSAHTRALRVTGLLLLAYAVCSTAGLLLFPMDVRGTVNSTRDPLHIAATAVQSFFLVGAIVAGAFIGGVQFKRYSLATAVIVVLAGALSGVLAGPMPGPTPWIGAAERVTIYGSMVWIAALSARLVQDPAGSRRPAIAPAPVLPHA